MMEVCTTNHVLMPGRYVGTEEEVDDVVPFEENVIVMAKEQEVGHGF